MLKEENKELKKAEKEQSENDSRIELLKQEIAELKQDKKEAEEKLVRKGKAGRKPDAEKKEKDLEKIKKMIDEGKTQEQICKKLKISKSTFYRRFRSVNNS